MSVKCIRLSGFSFFKIEIEIGIGIDFHKLRVPVAPNDILFRFR